MANLYERGSTFLKYLNVLRPNSTVPVFPTEYSAPTYEILFKDGSFTVVVPDTILTQGLNNVWFFSYMIPSNADLGTYLIKYKVTLNGVSAEVTEDYIVTLPSTGVGPGVGQYAITDTVESDSMVNLLGVDVFVFLPSDTNNAIAHATTDSSGNFTVQLDAGNYIVLFNKAGFISETHNLTVNVGGSHVFTGD